MRKRMMIPARTIAFILVFAIACITVLINKGYGASTGVYLETKDGTAILISERTPIVMSSNHNGDMFSELEKGDKILVMESWKVILPRLKLMRCLKSKMVLQVQFHHQ